jgi:hypothetical protein
LTPAKKSYITKLLENKKPEEIESNFQMVLEMFDKDQSDKREVLKESVKVSATTLASDTPKAVLTERHIQPAVEQTGEQNIMSSYLDGMKNLDR